MDKIRKNKIAIVLCMILLIAIGVLYLQNQNLKWEIISEKSVPDVELSNTLTFNSYGVASGGLTGFVAFYNTEQQPKSMRQYVRISASNEFINGRQALYLTDIIKMNVLAPRYLDPVVLTIENIEGNMVTLSDDNQNFIYVDNSRREVRMIDASGDTTKLITDDSDFRDFMRNFLSN